MSKEDKVEAERDKQDIDEYTKESYDIILNEYKDEINTVDEYNKEVSLLKYLRDKSGIFDSSIKFNISLILITLTAFWSIFVFLYKIKFTIPFIIFTVLLFVVCFINLCKSFSFLKNRGNSITNQGIILRLHILEQNKDIILNKQSKTWDEL